jgi:hypothetical protein
MNNEILKSLDFDLKQIKIGFTLLSKEDKKVIILMLYKYKELLNITIEDIKELSKIRSMDMTETMKQTIEQGLNQYTENEVNNGFKELVKHLDSEDIVNILKLKILPERVKTIIKEVSKNGN